MFALTPNLWEISKSWKPWKFVAKILVIDKNVKKWQRGAAARFFQLWIKKERGFPPNLRLHNRILLL